MLAQHNQFPSILTVSMENSTRKFDWNQTMLKSKFQVLASGHKKISLISSSNENENDKA